MNESHTHTNMQHKRDEDKFHQCVHDKKNQIEQKYIPFNSNVQTRVQKTFLINIRI